MSISMRTIVGVPNAKVNRNSDAVLRENVGMSIGLRVKAARERAELSQAELARRAGMGRSSLAELESGDTKSTGKLATIARECGVNAYWLETGKGSMSPETIQAIASVDRLERLNPEESELIQRYRDASVVKRMTILAASKADDALGGAGSADVTGN